MQTSNYFLPSDIICAHVFSELSPSELLTSICGTNKQLTDLAGKTIAERINRHQPLTSISDQIKLVDRFFRIIRGCPEQMTYLDYSNLKEEKPLYFLTKFPRHLICSASKEDLEIIEVFAKRCKLRHLTTLELELTEDFIDHKSLKSIFSHSKITQLKLIYLFEEKRCLISPFESIPSNLTHLTLHRAGITGKNLKLLRGQKFKQLEYLDLSHNSLLDTAAIKALFETHLPKLKVLKLESLGSERSLKVITPQIALTALENLSLKNTLFSKQHLFIRNLEKVSNMKSLTIKLLETEQNKISIKELQKKAPSLDLQVEYYWD